MSESGGDESDGNFATNSVAGGEMGLTRAFCDSGIKEEIKKKTITVWLHTIPLSAPLTDAIQLPNSFLDVSCMYAYTFNACYPDINYSSGLLCNPFDWNAPSFLEEQVECC
jgi:hypothetical protein